MIALRSLSAAAFRIMVLLFQRRSSRRRLLWNSESRDPLDALLAACSGNMQSRVHIGVWEVAHSLLALRHRGRLWTVLPRRIARWPHELTSSEDRHATAPQDLHFTEYNWTAKSRGLQSDQERRRCSVLANAARSA